MKKTFLGTGIALTLLSACAPKQSQETLTKSGLNPTNYETIVDGVKPVKLYTLKNAAGMEVCVTNFGCDRSVPVPELQKAIVICWGCRDSAVFPDKQTRVADK